MVQQACRAGLPSIILCPPNISGPYSAFLIKLVDALRAGAFALVDDGNTPCNLVDVSNLAYAIEIALDNGTADGKRMFITDDEKITWHDVIKSLIPVAECIEPVGVTREELRPLHGTNGKSSFSVMRSLKHVVSREVRAALRKDPFWAKLEEGLSQGVTRLGKVVEERLRLSIAGPPAITKPNGTPPYNMHLSAQQLRGVRHDCDLAKQELGYKPVYTFAASMAAFSAWYRSQHGMDTGDWDLLKLLY
jgi:nucleoside-diphosphate-sugar epimerase